MSTTKAAPKMRPLWVVTSVDADGVRRPLDLAKLAREEDEDAGCWTDIKVVRFEAVR